MSSGRSNTGKEGAALVGVGVVACAACCAGPIIGFLAAIGLGTAVGVAMFGAIALVVGGIALLFVLRRQRRTRAASCQTDSVPVEMSAAARQERRPRSLTQKP
jgi:hypothetical protein